MSVPEGAVLRRGRVLWVHVAGDDSLLEKRCSRAVLGTGLRWRKALLGPESWGGGRERSAYYNKGRRLLETRALPSCHREDLHFKATRTFRSFADSQPK